MPYEDVYEAYEESYDQTVEDRQDSMDELEGSYVEHDPVIKLSDEMARLLDPSSEYMTGHISRTKEDMLAAGYADSQYLTDVGRASAIDASYKTAMSNIGGYTYDDILLNEKYVQDYSADYDIILRQLEAGYEGIEQGMEDLYKSEDLRERAEDQKELSEVLSGYELERIALEQQYDLEKKDVQNRYDMKALETDYGYQALQTKSQSDLDLNRTYFGLANWQLSSNMVNQQNLSMSYLSQSQTILASDLDPEDKWAQLESLKGRAQTGITEAGMWQQVGDNPYSYEDLVGMTLPMNPDEGSGVYEGGQWFSSGGVSNESMTEFLVGLDRSFRDEMGTKERHRFKTAKQVDDLLTGWPSFVESHPDEAKAINKWFTTIAEEEILQNDDEAYIDVIRIWYDMVRYLRQPEGRIPFIPTIIDPDGELAPPAYKDFEYKDGDIYVVMYTPVAYYCIEQDPDDYSTGFVRKCSTTPTGGRGGPSYYEHKQVYSNITGDDEWEYSPSDLEGAYV